MLVREVMSSPPVTVMSDASLKAAMALLECHDVSAMPVVDTAGRIVGVLSEADVIRELVAPDQRTHEIPVPMVTAPSARLVADVMTTHPVTVAPGTDLAVATELMTSSAIKSLPVVAQGRVVGVVSRRDVIRVLAKPDDLTEGEIDDLFRRVGYDWLVDVRDGVVTVQGPSGGPEQRLAEALARTVPGVVALRFDPDPDPGRAT